MANNPFSKRPILDLENQYTYLKKKKKNIADPLLQFSNQLAKNKENRLPKIGSRHLNTTRKIEQEVNDLKLLLLARQRRQQQILSQQRLKPNYPTFVMHMPMGGYYLPQQQQQPTYNQPVSQNLPSPPPKSEEAKNEMPSPQSRIEKKVNKIENKSKLNRFRICAYAVYFSIYIKYFAKKFTENRKNWFNERYAINNGKVVFDGSANILRKLYEIDIYKMILDGKKKAHDIDRDTMSISKDNQQKTDFIGGTANFTLIILEFLSQLMTSQQFIEENHQVFTVGVLNQNFMISNLYLPQQAAILHIHPAGYIQIDEQTEILMLMIKIILKITVYNFLLSLRFSRKWNLKQEKSYNLDHTEMEEVWEITRTAGIFFLIACEEIYDSTVRNISHTCNFQEMAPKLGIVPAKHLEQMKDGSGPNSSTISTDLLEPGSKFIHNLQKYNEVVAMVAKIPYLQRFKDKLKMKIIDFLTSVYTCLKYQEYYVYDFIRDMTYDEKYIILQGKKRQLEEKSKNKKGKKKKKQNLQKSSKNISMFGSMAAKEKQSRRNSKWSEMPGSSQNYTGQSSGLVNPNSINQMNQDGSSEEIGSDEDEEGKIQGKKMKYRHEQMFYDRKFRGHSKLERLKGRMKGIKSKKVI